MLSIYLLGDDINHLRFPILCDDSKGNLQEKQESWLIGVQEALSQSVLNYKYTKFVGKSIKITKLQKAEQRNWDVLTEYLNNYVK